MDEYDLYVNEISAAMDELFREVHEAAMRWPKGKWVISSRLRRYIALLQNPVSDYVHGYPVEFASSDNTLVEFHEESGIVRQRSIGP